MAMGSKGASTRPEANENNTMRYTILDVPPWWESIALGFQVGVLGVCPAAAA